MPAQSLRLPVPGPSAFAVQVRAGVEAARRTADLDTLAKGLWAGLGSDLLGEDEATAISDAIEAKRAALRGGQGGVQPGAALAVQEPRRQTIFARARAQTPPDRQRSIERRRRLAASGPVPPKLAAHFTTGELAVLRIVADEVRAHGVCFRTVDELAARAGVSASTVRNAVRYAVALKLLAKRERPRPGRKHLSNLLSITSKEWRKWTDRRPPSRWAAAAPGGKPIAFKKVEATDTKIRKEGNHDGGGASSASPLERRDRWKPGQGRAHVG